MADPMKVKARLTALMDQMGIEKAHFGVQNTAELDPIIGDHSGRVATLTIVGPNPVCYTHLTLPTICSV